MLKKMLFMLCFLAAGISYGQNGTNTISKGQQLNVGEKLVSTNGAYSLEMQSDGNLVIYQVSPRSQVWSTGTGGQGNGCFVSLKANGNLVIYNPDRSRVLWGSGTMNCNVVKAVLSDFGNLMLYTSTGEVCFNYGLRSSTSLSYENCDVLFIGNRYNCKNFGFWTNNFNMDCGYYMMHILDTKKMQTKIYQLTGTPTEPYSEWREISSHLIQPGVRNVIAGIYNGFYIFGCENGEFQTAFADRSDDGTIVSPDRFVYYQGAPNHWIETPFSLCRASKKVVCSGKYYTLGSNNNIYEYYNGAYREIKRDVTDIGSTATTLTCVYRGKTMYYGGSPDIWHAEPDIVSNWSTVLNGVAQTKLFRADGTGETRVGRESLAFTYRFQDANTLVLIFSGVEVIETIISVNATTLVIRDEDGVENTYTRNPVSNTLPEITCGTLKYRKTATNDVEEFKNGAWRTVGRGVSEISCTGQGELKVMYNGSPLYFLGEPDAWSNSAFTMSNISKRVTCNGKYFIMGANTNVYEFYNNAWREIGRGVTDIGCDGTTFTCVHLGRTLRYQGSPNSWQ